MRAPMIEETKGLYHRDPMIAFGCTISEPSHYRRYSEPGIRLAAEPDSVLFVDAAPFSAPGVTNLILDRAAAHQDLEALVLVNERAEILDPLFCQKLRQALSDPEVAVVGCAGAAGVQSIAWWEGKSAWASSVYRSEEFGGELPALVSDGWNGATEAFDSGPGEVDVVDGVLMALSPWAVRNIRFDESLGPRYGFDIDFCLQVCAAKRKVVTADLKVAHYYPLGVIDDPDVWIEAHMRAAEKWDARPSTPTGGHAPGAPRRRRPPGGCWARRRCTRPRRWSGRTSASTPRQLAA
jgi:hypothetical protein